MKNFNKIVNHLITTGFVYPSSEIYGGLSNSWDYGPLGVELKQNIKKLWWQKFVHESTLNVGIDSAILMNPKVWEATGHVTSFNDPLIDCKSCKMRFRADELIKNQFPNENVDKMTNDELSNFVKNNDVVCPNCGKHNFTDIRQFNMMFKTHIGVTDDSKSVVYLRPETAQGVFVNFKNVQRTTRKKLPFGICNVGKSFRNEITPGNFIFRTREFEQMECEFFVKPEDDLKWYDYWKKYCMDFLLNELSILKDNLRFRNHEKEELAFYSKATCDIEYNFPFGWGEIWGIADRTDYDLKKHMEYSKESLEYVDTVTNQKIIPYVIEPSVGLDRLMLMSLVDSYDEETLENGETRIVMHLDKKIAPIKIAILPLSKQLSEKALSIYKQLVKKYNCQFDESGSIGKRYRRQDSIGTPFCVTVDFDTLNDDCVTIRFRDDMSQKRIKVEEISKYID